MINDEKLVRSLLHSLLLKHPLPWRIETDWGYNIFDSNNAEVIHCLSSPEEAETIIEKASALKEASDKLRDEIAENRD